VPNHPDTKEENQSKVLLIAQLRAFLASGESFDLLPIKHELDVKTEVESLVESWAESGFLVHGRFIYPWHQVKHVEVTQVEEMPLQLAHQRFEELYAAQRARMQEDFWRTRQKSEKKTNERTQVRLARPIKSKSWREWRSHASRCLYPTAVFTSVPTSQS
jgi:hypothetical protein